MSGVWVSFFMRCCMDELLGQELIYKTWNWTSKKENSSLNPTLQNRSVRLFAKCSRLIRKNELSGNNYYKILFLQNLGISELTVRRWRFHLLMPKKFYLIISKTFWLSHIWSSILETKYHLLQMKSLLARRRNHRTRYKSKNRQTS